MRKSKLIEGQKRMRKKILQRLEDTDKKEFSAQKIPKKTLKKGAWVDQMTSPRRFPNLYRRLSQSIIPQLKKEGLGKEKPITVNVIGAGSKWVGEQHQHLVTYQPEEIQRELIKHNVNYKITATDRYPDVVSVLEKRDKLKWLDPKIERVKLRFPFAQEAEKRGPINMAKCLANAKVKQADITLLTISWVWPSYRVDLIKGSTKKGGYAIIDDKHLKNSLLKEGFVELQKIPSKQPTKILYVLKRKK